MNEKQLFNIISEDNITIELDDATMLVDNTDTNGLYLCAKYDASIGVLKYDLWFDGDTEVVLSEKGLEKLQILFEKKVEDENDRTGAFTLEDYEIMEYQIHRGNVTL